MLHGYISLFLGRQNRLTDFVGTTNSSTETRDRAATLTSEIGAYHLNVSIDRIIDAIMYVFQTLTGKTPKFRAHGGSNAENLALQNIQARIRMVFSYMLAQLLPWVRGRSGFLLVLGSANVDEALRGYMTKYDCSSADINPIGGICKQDLKSFLLWAADHMEMPSLKTVVAAPPTAELEPITADYKQEDEVDMGMSYKELGIFGELDFSFLFECQVLIPPFQADCARSPDVVHSLCSRSSRVCGATCNRNSWPKRSSASFTTIPSTATR